MFSCYLPFDFFLSHTPHTTHHTTIQVYSRSPSLTSAVAAAAAAADGNSQPQDQQQQQRSSAGALSTAAAVAAAAAALMSPELKPDLGKITLAQYKMLEDSLRRWVRGLGIAYVSWVRA